MDTPQGTQEIQNDTTGGEVNCNRIGMFLSTETTENAQSREITFIS
jgi:hypothetical protein